ncbi:hypothetical protein IT402_02920 [Candidatus Nomurabacteria bacterium]|nr:hypothetical protein [Candidatus Nomurabacteria bacterium]
MKKVLFLLVLVSIFFSINLIKAGAEGEISFNKDASFKKDSGNTYILSGSIDKTKHKDTDPTPLETITVSAFFYTQPKTNSSTPFYSTRPIKLEKSSGGKYTFELNRPPLEQNTYYSIVINFESDNGTKSEYLLKDVSTEKGIVPESGKARDDFFNKNSYRLLAPIPGMVALLDPELCQLEQTRNPGQICDINAFLNFLLSLAIGAAAVVLVVRIIISGYGYMVSDIPFVKAKLKGNFIEALIGLVVALSAYLILNTINPRLVSNDVKIGVAEFNVEETLAITAAGYDPNSQAAKNLSPEEIRKIKISYEGKRKAIKEIYAPARDRAIPNTSQGIRLLMTAHISMEGFYPGSMSYRTNNPGNIGNVGANNQGISQKRTCYATLENGIKRQYSHIANLVSGNNPSYKIGRKVEVIPSAQRYPGESWIYDGSLWQYLYIYAPESPEKRNAYLSHVISFFASEGMTINRETKMKDLFGNSPATITNPPTIDCPASAW